MILDSQSTYKLTLVSNLRRKVSKQYLGTRSRSPAPKGQIFERKKIMSKSIQNKAHTEALLQTMEIDRDQIQYQKDVG